MKNKENQFKVITPFKCKNIKKVTKLLEDGVLGEKFEKTDSVRNSYFSENIEAFFQCAAVYRCQIDENAEIEIILLPTKRGYIICEYGKTSEDIESYTKWCEDLFKNNVQKKTYEITATLEKQEGIVFQRKLWMFLCKKQHSSLDSEEKYKLYYLDDNENQINGDYDIVDNSLVGQVELVKRSYCYYTNKCIGLSVKQGSCEENDNIFRAFTYMFVVLQHEYALLLDLKNQIFTNKKSREIRKLKSDILECLSKYTFDVYSEHTNIQNVFLHYRELLHIERIEETTRDLIFSIDGEISQKSDRRLAVIGVILALSGINDFIELIGSIKEWLVSLF